MNADVKKRRADLVLLSCYVITGILDSCAVSIWGSFVSMQTGNTVYLGLGIADPEGSNRWIKSLMSIVFFCLGSFCFSRFHRYFGPKRRWVLVASFSVQMALISGAAAITTSGVSDEGNDLHWSILVPLALVAFQSCGQAVTSRALQYNSLTSVVLTSIYCDLFSDAKLFSLDNVERNRRGAAPILLLIGAICGGIFSRSPLGLSGALWTAVVLKAFIVLAWLLWKAEPDNEEER